ncbi:hypothetical protein CRENBAI_010933 [Crenichthys baileyi]|uniref:Metalloendopeptidase n=1 Tax=Crenichthys baileyi TaxID=28760 RepID=A0AAV9SRQ6_9TELE
MPTKAAAFSHSLSTIMEKVLFLLGLVALTTSFTIPHSSDVHEVYENGEDENPLLNINSDENLFEGDILIPKGRNALTDQKYRWKFPIPYILGDDLDLNAKGCVHQAFEMYRLKSCVDFKPYEGEKTYIKFEKRGGCFSSVGDQQNGQILSLGSGCDHKAVVEHELLHALGFYHEQSRTDRDDYVDIWLDQVTPDAGYFMYFNTRTGEPLQSALLESRTLYPKRKLQCLQFFYKMTGSSQDRLVIWTKMDDGTGTVRRMKKIHTFYADSDHSWKIGHVPLEVGVKFRYAFQAVRGDPTASIGGIYIDDISLTETRCPNAVWTIRNFSKIIETADANTVINSPRFYSREGYGYGIRVIPLSSYSDYTGNFVGLYFHLASGENDAVMKWPAVNRQATLVVMDQDPDILQRMSSARSLTTDMRTTSDGQFLWDNPSKVGKYDPYCDCYRGESWGWRNFIKYFDLRRRNYLKGDDLIIFTDFEDLTSLIKTEVPIVSFEDKTSYGQRQSSGAVFSMFPSSNTPDAMRNANLNAKGVILQAFEEYRLRSCVDFKPYNGESTYISFVKLSGCWSYVGDDRTGQNVSIGARCDTKAIVEHELLHALGFYHEQSRSDRDDYVKIWWDEIEEGKQHNFNKYEDDFITDLNTPYDYESIMHYRPLSFNKNESIPTITTTIPYFNDVIGQRLDFSEVDITRLNRMYACAETHTLLDQCTFELINICGMIQNEEDNADWVQTRSSPSDEDHTLGGHCRDSGSFMRFDTSSGAAGNSGLLESRILYPKRGEQCLQFFYRMTGAAGDKLVIWLRSDDGTGAVNTFTKIHTIIGEGDDAWKIAHVTLKTSKKFRYIFQGIRGSASSSGAILIDDITLTETVCPSLVWQIHNFTGLLTTTPLGMPVKSKCAYNSEGYSFGVSVYPTGRHSDYPDYVGIALHLCSGENDGVMQWPAENRQATIVALDQDPDVTLRMSSTRSFTTDNNTRWDKPTATSGTVWDESCQCYRNQDYGWSAFISRNHLQRRNFLKNDDLIITADFNDLTHLIKTEVPVDYSIQGRDLTDIKEDHEVALMMSDVLVLKMMACMGSTCKCGGCKNLGWKVKLNLEEVLERSVWSEGADASAGPLVGTRCATTQTTFYTGPRCEEVKIVRGILGALVGGAAGTVVLTLAIFTVIRKAHTNPF